MGMVVRTNIMGINANRQLGMNNNQVSKSLENFHQVTELTALVTMLLVLQSAKK